MKTFYLVTSNQGKIDQINQFLSNLTDNIKIEMMKLDFPELKGETLEETALNKAKTCYDMIRKDVIVSDTGLFIDALNGFPGVNTATTLSTIGNEGLLKLLEGEKNRNAKSCVSYAIVTKEYQEIFSAESNIFITDSIGGSKGYGWDKIATDKKGVRFSEDESNETRLFPYREALRKLVDFIENK
ncbi:non-canonical purine NTP pyrophosphatase [Candidatus Woesearchaeota archaeon]|nr:MAG: non-canonical purine NTP pyrophosphatase [Candidatus Woesearchaeota archaeon]